MKKRVTIKDLANHLCLSVSTVSRALSDDKNIRRETKEIIFRAAEELGYRRNVLASSLRKGRSYTVGLIMSEKVAPFGPELINGIQESLHANGINVIICSTGSSPEWEKKNLHLLDTLMVDGIIVNIYDKNINTEEFDALISKHMPMVFLGENPAGMEVNQVTVNFFDKSFFLLHHLICDGRRRIALLRPCQDSTGNSELTKAYHEALSQFGIKPDPDLVQYGCTSMEESRRLVDSLIERKIEFDALFTSSELTAIAAMNRLREHGLRVPEDVAVATFSGTDVSMLAWPNMTSVETDYTEMGREVGRLMLDAIENPDAPPRKIIFDSHIRLRGSSHSVK